MVSGRQDDFLLGQEEATELQQKDCGLRRNGGFFLDFFEENDKFSGIFIPVLEFESFDQNLK
jgi:hypothetical protein